MATNPVAETTLPRERIGRFSEVAAREQLVLLAFAGVVAALAVGMAEMVVGDTWLAVVDGRWIAQHGLPRADELTMWTQGVQWIDQQWLAHLGLYEAMRAGGIGLVIGLALAFDVLALALAALASRRAGISPRATAVALMVPFIVAPSLLQARTQSFALPLFVALYALLGAESRTPSRRVWLAVPLLIVWANLHGTVLLGAGLVVLYAITTRREWTTRAVLALVAPSAVLASPYGLDLIHYYKTMLFSTPLREYNNEWQPPGLTLGYAGFFVVAAAVVFLLVRHRSSVSLFQLMALPLLIVAGLLSARSTGWVAWAFAVGGGVLLDREWTGDRARQTANTRIGGRIAAAVVAAALLLLAVRTTQSDTAQAERWPSAAAAAVASSAGATGTVFADDAHADWLLWEQPALTGRVAYDIRFELFDRRQFTELQALRDGVNKTLWRGYDVITYSRTDEGSALRAAGALNSGRRIYADPRFVAFEAAP